MITQFRKIHNLTQKEMAEILGYNKRTIEYYETRENKGKIKQTMKYIKLRSDMVKYNLGKVSLRTYEKNIRNFECKPIVQLYSPLDNLNTVEEDVKSDIRWFGKFIFIVIFVILSILLVELSK